MLQRKPKIKVIVQESVGIKKYRVIQERPYNSGWSMDYKNYLNLFESVNVPADYSFIKTGDGFRYVGKIAGNNSAAPLRYSNNGSIEIGLPVWPDCPGYNLSILVSNDIWANATRTLFGKKPFPWKILLIIAIVVVVGVIGFQALKGEKTPSTPTVIQQEK